jgi:hypothetical protein
MWYLTDGAFEKVHRQAIKQTRMLFEGPIRHVGHQALRRIAPPFFKFRHHLSPPTLVLTCRQAARLISQCGRGSL